MFHGYLQGSSLLGPGEPFKVEGLVGLQQVGSKIPPEGGPAQGALEQVHIVAE